MPDSFTATHAGASVKAYQRKNGAWALNWSEAGTRRSTTRTIREGAEEFAKLKARKLAAATGSEWITPAQADSLKFLQNITGPEGSTFAILSDLRDALHTLAGAGSLNTAAAYYMQSGPGTIQTVSADEAIARFLAEYPAGKTAGTKTPRTVLKRFQENNPSLLLLDITPDIVRANAFHGNPAPQTIINRLSAWRTFFNRCRDWELLPAGKKHPAELIKRPRLPEASPPIFTVAQGKTLLSITREKKPRLLPFAILAGWMGLRSSETERLEWTAFDWEQGTLHLSIRVAKKLLQERFIPIPPEVAAALRPLMPANGRGKCCRLRDQKNLSLLYRGTDDAPEWPQNGLRHSWFSYTLARTENIHQLAEWGGNSAPVIRRKYRRPLPKSAGKEWLQLLADLPPQ